MKLSAISKSIFFFLFLLNSIFYNFASAKCNDSGDMPYVGRPTRGLVSEKCFYGEHRLTKLSAILEAEANALPTLYQYFTEISKVSFRDQDGNPITNRKIALDLSIRNVGMSSQFPPIGVEIRNDISNFHKMKVFLEIDEVGNIKTLSTRYDEKPNLRIDFNKYKNNLTTDVFWKRPSYTRVDITYGSWVPQAFLMDVLNGLSNKDMSEDLENNFSIIGEVQDFGPAVDVQLEVEKKILAELQKTYSIVESKKLDFISKFSSWDNTQGLKQAQICEQNNNLKKIGPGFGGPLQKLDMIAIFTTKITQFNEELSSLKQKADKLKVSIKAREQITYLKGQKVDVMSSQGHIKISKFMDTNSNGYKLLQYMGKTKGSWRRIIPKRSIFSVTAELNTNIFDEQYNVEYKKQLKHL